VDPLFEFALSVKATQREFERASNELMKPLGLTGPQADALSVIAAAGPIALKDLGHLLIAEAGHPSRLVDRLVEAGFVQRRAAEDDRRRVELRVTPSGRRLARRVSEARQALWEAGQSSVDRAQLEASLALLRGVLKDSPLGEVIERRRELE
jgi:DNA-binding MarR family transcriptional regulator